jgi:ankyrin repeat protein
MASVNDTDADGRTPLWIAAQQGDMGKARWLVKVGKARVDQTDNNEETPLHVAAPLGYGGLARRTGQSKCRSSQ